MLEGASNRRLQTLFSSEPIDEQNATFTFEAADRAQPENGNLIQLLEGSRELEPSNPRAKTCQSLKESDQLEVLAELA